MMTQIQIMASESASAVQWPGATRSARSGECPVCNTGVAPDVEACPRCGWPVQWILQKSDTSDEPARSPSRAAARPRHATSSERKRSGSAAIYVAAAAVLATVAWWLHQGALETAPAAALSVSAATESAPAPATVAQMDAPSPTDSRQDDTVRVRERMGAAPPVIEERPTDALATRVAPAPKQDVQAWRTAAGKLYFGIAPPPGSEQVSAIARLKSAPVPQSPPVAANPDAVDLALARRAPSLPPISVEAAVVAAPISYGWRSAANCKSATAFDGLRVQVDSVRQEQTITGVLKNTADTLIKEVTVCRDGACTPVADGRVLQAREGAPFTLHVPRIDWSPISVECTLLERT